VASPAEYGMTIILERLCISPTEAIRQEINHICNNTSHQTEAETHVPGIYATVTKGGKEYPRYPYGRKKP
jgi:hypothetical protein